MICPKQRHLTYQAARDHLENLDGIGLHIYSCEAPECRRAYHVGHTDNRHQYPTVVGAQAEIEAMGPAGQGFEALFCFDCHAFEVQRERPNLRWGRRPVRG